MLSKKGKGVYGKIKFGDWLAENARESLNFSQSKNKVPCEINPNGIHKRTRFDRSIALKNSRNPKPAIHLEPLSLIVTPY